MTPQALTIVIFIFNLLIGLVLGLTAYTVRRLVSQMDKNTSGLELMKLRLEKNETECANCRTNLLTEEKMRQIMTESIHAAMVEMELHWVNEGRIMPKYRQKAKEAKSDEN